MSTGAVAAGGISSLSGTALARENKGKSPIQEVSRAKENKLRAEALQTDELKILRQYVIKNLDAKLRINGTSVYEAQVEDKSVHSVVFPIEGVENSFDASVAITTHEETVVDALGVIGIADGDKVAEVSEFRVTEDGSIDTTTAPTATPEDRKKVVTESEILNQITVSATESGNCGQCAFVVRRICDYGCIIGGALFCTLVGLATAVIGGLICSVLYGIYCYEFGYPCYRFGSPRADCDRLFDVC